MAEKKIPTVRIGDNRIPAHRLWNVVESITTATDLVEKFNENRPELTTPVTREVVATVRERIRAMDLAMGGDGAMQAAAEAAGVAGAAAGAGAGERAGAKFAADGNADAAGRAGGGRGENEIAAKEQARGSTEIADEPGERRLLSDEAFAEAARQLLQAMSVEDALAMLKADYDNPVDIRSLIDMVGKEDYLAALGREAGEFAANMIAPDQIAELWNESGFPSPIGGLWTTGDVERLLP